MDDRDGEEEEEEEEEEEAEGDDNEFVDLLDVLDGKGGIDMTSDSENPSNRRSAENPSLKIDDKDKEDAELSSHEDSNSNSGSASEEEEEKLDFDPSDDEEMPEALDQLNNFVSNLDVTSTKRKATEDPSEVGAARARKRRLVKERTEAGAENEFRAQSSGIFILFYTSSSFLAF